MCVEILSERVIKNERKETYSKRTQNKIKIVQWRLLEKEQKKKQGSNQVRKEGEKMNEQNKKI